MWWKVMGKGQALGFYRFLTFFPASGRVGWFWQLPPLVFEECRASPIPLELCFCFSLGNPRKWYSTWLFPSGFPNLFLGYSFHFPPKNPRWEWVGKGKHSVFLDVWRFSQLLGELGGSGSCPLWFLGSAGHPHTLRIIFFLVTSQKMVFNLALSEWFSQPFSPIFFHFLPENPWWEWVEKGKHSVFLGF